MKIRAQLILMLILMILVMMSGCGTDSVEYDTESVPNNRILSGKTVYVNDNYHFTLPKGTKRAETRFDEDSGMNEKAYGFATDDGYYYNITSFHIDDSGANFYELVEYLTFEADENAQIEYEDFDGAEMATATAEGRDADNEPVYVTSFWWQDGEESVCCVEIGSYKDKPGRVEELIRNSIEADVMPTYESVELEEDEYTEESKYGDSQYGDMPSQEELDQIIKEDMAKAYEEYMVKQEINNMQGNGYY